MTVYTIPLGHSFLDHLAQGLIEETKHKPFQLAKYVILLPTKRGCLTLQHAFFNHANTKSLILPKIIALSELETSPHLPGFSLTEEIPEAISNWQQSSLLTQLIYQYYQQQPNPIDYATAFSQAQALVTLLDEFETSAIDVNRLHDLVGENFASHWQITLNFLKIITEFWPTILSEQNKLSPSYRKRKILESIANQWCPSYPVILAGTTGTRPATAQLAKAILAMDQGRIVLPGFDPETPWPVPATHPQYTLSVFIHYLGITPDRVSLWPTISTTSSRSIFLRQVMTPVIPDNWHIPEVVANELQSFAMIPCSHSEEEVTVIALICRYHLETPEKTITIITPDRTLGERLRATLNRWTIVPDLSSGLPLTQTVVGQFLRLCSMVKRSISVVDWLALMKHPLTFKGSNRPQHLVHVRAFERHYLRGKRIGTGLWDLFLKENSLQVWFQNCRQLAQPLLDTSGRQPFSHWLTHHINVAKKLCGKDDILWQDDDGEVALDFITQLLNQEDLLPPLTHQEYSRIFAELMDHYAVRFVEGIGSRIRILGALEARQNHSDVVILAGLNEGIWPKGEQTDPWLNRSMRLSLGLPDPQRQIGLSAHDFCLGFNSPQVYLTRSLKAEGRATIASRWWQRLEALLSTTQRTSEQSQNQWLAWARQLSYVDKPSPCSQPTPLPPQNARPTTLSATDIDHLMRDPYSLYARKILRLKALDWLEPDLTMREWGIRVHDILDQFVRKPSQSLDLLLDLGQQAFQDVLSDPTVATFWWPRFVQMAEWFYHHWHQDAPLRRFVASEYHGKISLDPFEIYSRADRIDQFNNGITTLVDYKTGEPPSEKLVLLGLAPQLLVEATILNNQGFPTISPSPTIQGAFWQLKGGLEGGKIKVIPLPSDTLSLAFSGLQKLLNHYYDPQTPYLSHPWGDWLNGVIDYQHLSRFKEWRLQPWQKDDI